MLYPLYLIFVKLISLHLYNFISRFCTSATWNLYVNVLRHIQFINDVSDVLHPSSGYNSGLQNFNLKNICIINTPYGNKTILISWLNVSINLIINNQAAKVTYFTLQSHTLIFITLAEHDFNDLGFLMCVFP